MSEAIGPKEVATFFRNSLAEHMRLAELVVRDAGDAVVIHLDWPLEGDRRRRSREITVKINAAAVKAFCDASPRERGAMHDRFLKIYFRRIDGEYKPEDPPHPPFIITIDEHDFGP